MYQYVFWQGVISIHQSALLRNLAAIHAANVTLVVWEDLPTNRKKLGWQLPDLGKVRTILKPTIHEQSELFSEDNAKKIHIFSGTRGYPSVWEAFRKSLSFKTIRYIQAESQNANGVKGLLRLVRSKYDAVFFREKIDLVLGIGSLGVEWYKKSGYFPNRIVPFGYFVETPITHLNNLSEKIINTKTVEIIFIGRPLFGKGLDILFFALSKLTDLDWRLHVVGDGEDREKFSNMCKKLGFSSRVLFHGVMINPDVINLLTSCDLLVLPSRWDGWGAVVNEALMCGVPVICSNKCGAADLIKGTERGYVFQTGSIAALESALRKQILLGKKDPRDSAEIKEWSNCITGEAAAKYLEHITVAFVNGSSFPLPPWQD